MAHWPFVGHARRAARAALDGSVAIAPCPLCPRLSLTCTVGGLLTVSLVDSRRRCGPIPQAPALKVRSSLIDAKRWLATTTAWPCSSWCAEVCPGSAMYTAVSGLAEETPDRRRRVAAPLRAKQAPSEGRQPPAGEETRLRRRVAAPLRAKQAPSEGRQSPAGEETRLRRAGLTNFERLPEASRTDRPPAGSIASKFAWDSPFSFDP